MRKIEGKERYFLVEFLLTFFLALGTVFLFQEFPRDLKSYAAFGLVCGFGFSWFNRDKRTALIKTFTVAGTLGCGVWFVYAAKNSPLQYKDLVSLAVKTGFLLQVILSFDCYNGPVLFFIRTVNLAAFLCFPLFVKWGDGFSVALSLVYFAFWAALLRAGHHGFLDLSKEKRPLLSAGVPLVFFSVSVWLSFSLFQHVDLKQIEKIGFLPSEGDGREIMREKGEVLEKEFYDLQDSLFTELAGLSGQKETKKEIFRLFDDLMDESLSVAQVERAQDGLIDLLKRPGPGLDRGDEKSIALKLNDYVDKKIVLGLKKQKSDAQDQLDDASFSLRERREISSEIEKIQRARGHRALIQHEKKSREAIEGSRASEPVKQALKKTVRRMKGFRALQLYRQRLTYLEEKIASVEEPLRQELAALLAEIDGIEKISDLEGAQGDLQSFRSVLPSDRDDLLDQIEELLALKAELFLEAQGQAVNDELDALREDEPQLQVAKNDLEDILSAQDSDEFSRGISGFQGKVKGASQGFNDVLEAKSRAFIAQSEARVRKRLKEAVLTDGSKKIAEDFARLGSVREVDQLFIRVEKLKEEIEKSSQEGLIAKDSKDDLIKEAEYIKDVIFCKLDALGKEGELMGSGGPGQEALEIPEEAFLAKIKIVPDLIEVALGEDYQAAAVGIYSDGVEEDLTLRGVWTSSDEEIFSVSQGLVESHAVGKAMLSMSFDGIKGLPMPVMVGEAQLASLLVSPQDASLSLGDRVDFKVEGYFTDSSHKDLTPYVRWEVSVPRVLRIEKAQARPLMFGNAQVYAFYEKLRSLPSRVRVVLTPAWLLGVVLKVVSFLLAGLAILASLLFAITQIRKNRLKARLRKDPREFIIGLYDNFRDILRLFGLKEGDALPPLYFAYLVISRYPVENEVFLSFTKKYEEAKYSRHEMNREDVLPVLEDYNRSLKMLFSGQGRPALFFKYCLALYKRTPLFIRVVRRAASASSGRLS